MKTDTAMKFVVPKGWRVTEEVMPDGSREFTIKPDIAIDNTASHLRKALIKKVPASELSLDDDFLKYSPQTEKEEGFMEDVKKVIATGVPDFWCPICDPSFDENGCICYELGKMPAVGKSAHWWYKNAKDFCPERGSRLGTKTEYIAKKAVLIKQLIASGKSVKWAWNAVCNDSKELGHYWNSKDAKRRFEPTGSREICGWFDLANCNKILAEDEEAGGFWLAGGNYGRNSYHNPLAFLFHYDDRYNFNVNGCGWLVFDRCPD